MSRADVGDSVADVRSAGFGITPPGGHPSELFPAGGRPSVDGEDGPDDKHGDVGELVMPFCTTPEEAVSFIPKLVAAGSDYIKFMVDDGTVEGHPGLPMLDQATLNAGVAEADEVAVLAEPGGEGAAGAGPAFGWDRCSDCSTPMRRKSFQPSGYSSASRRIPSWRKPQAR